MSDGSPSTFETRMVAIAAGVQTGVREAVQTFCKRFIDNVTTLTPVDTGQARANWQARIGDPFTSFIQLPSYKKLKGKHTPDTGIIETTNRLAHTVIETYSNNGQIVYLSNNAPYMQYLNAGSSPQAPSGFVEGALADAFNELRALKVIK